MSKASDLLKRRLRENRVRLFTTADAAVALGVAKAHASVILGREAEMGEFIRLARGRWALLSPNAPHPFAVARFIAHPNSIYITGPSALHHHGILLQIPKTLHVAWNAKPRLFSTPLGDIYLHALPDPEENEVETLETPEGPVLIARPEKALFDTARLAASPRGKASLFPELNLDEVDYHEIRELLNRIPKPRYRRRIEALLHLPPKPSKAPLDPILDRITKWAEKAGGWERIGFFVGAGLSANCGLPLGAALPRHLLRSRRFESLSDSEAGKLLGRLQPDQDGQIDLPQCLEEVRIALGKNWTEAVQELFRNANPGELHLDLVNLGASLFLTTNLDRLLERAISRRQGRHVSPMSWPGDESSLPNLLREVGPRVIHLHGDVDKPDRWVLTRRDYEKVREDQELKTFVTNALLDRPFLFIGFGMTEADRHLTDVLAEITAQLRSWKHEHLALFPEEYLEEDRRSRCRESERLEVRLSERFEIESLAFPKEEIAPLISGLRERAAQRAISTRKESPWRREIFSEAMRIQAEPWWKWYQEPRVIRNWEYRSRVSEPLKFEIRAHVTGLAPGLPPAEVLRESRVILLGDFGLGKSTYLKRRFAEFGEDLKLFKTRPRLYLSLRQATKRQDFSALAASQFRGPNSEDALREFIEAAGLFLVDGLDEVADTNPDILADLADFARRNPRCGFVIASRPIAALPSMTADGAGHSIFSDWPVLHLLPWKSEQVQDYVKMRLGDELEPDDRIREILQVPVFLAAYCELREADPSSAPKNVSGILSTLLEKLLQRALLRGNLKKITIPIAKEILAAEAFAMEKKRIYAKPRGEWFAEVMRDESAEVRLAFQQELLEGSLLLPRGDNLEFQHRIWQSYLAGLHLPKVLQDQGEPGLEAAIIPAVELRGIPSAWYLPLRFGAEPESEREIKDFIWKCRDLDELGVARILPSSADDEWNQWAFEKLIDHYDKAGLFLHREAIGGLFDEETLGSRASCLGERADAILKELISRDEARSRRLGLQVAIAGGRERLLGECIDVLLQDENDEVVAQAVRAAQRFNLGSATALVDALRTLDDSGVGYNLTASVIVELLRHRDPEGMGDLLFQEIEKRFIDKQPLEQIFRWLLPESKDLLTPEQLRRLAEAFPLAAHGVSMPLALIHRAFQLQGAGPERILVLGYSMGLEEETNRHFLEDDDDDEPIIARIEQRLRRNPRSTVETIFWLLARIKDGSDLPRRALKLFTLTGEDPFKYRKELLLDKGEFSFWIARTLAEEYWKPDRKKARQIIKAFGIDDSELYYAEHPAISARRPRPPRHNLEDVIKKCPADWLHRISESMAKDAGLLPPEIRDRALNDSLGVLEKVAPEDAVTPGEEKNSFSVNRAWQNALKVIERLGFGLLPESADAIIARLVPMNEHGWFFTREILEARCELRPSGRVKDALLRHLRQAPPAGSVSHIISILRETGMKPDAILENVREIAARYKDQPEAAHLILTQCREAKAAPWQIVQSFVDSAAPEIRFKALAITVARAGRDSSQEERRKYLEAVTEISTDAGLGIWDYSDYMIPISIAGLEDEVAQLVKDLYPEISKKRPKKRFSAIPPGHFEKERAFNWAIDRLTAGETVRSIQALRELANDSSLDLRHFADLAERARLNWLDKARIHR